MAEGDTLRTLMTSDIGASGETGVVPSGRKINNKALTADVTLNASDVGAVPDTRKINNKALSSDIVLSAEDVPYDNTTSGLEAADVQEAVDELAAEVDSVAGEIPAASDEAPLMDGTGAAGASDAYARADHVHPSDTSKANTDGLYENLTAGNAEQLIGTLSVVDKTPYIFRPTAGNADVGDRCIPKLVGGTICWNQLAQAASSGWTAAGVSISTSGTKITIKATSGSTAHFAYKTLATGHVYFASGISYGTGSSEYSARIGFNTSSAASISGRGNCVSAYASRSSGSTVYKATSGDRFVLRISPNSAPVGTTAEFDKVMLINLTTMFGADVADYIASLPTNSESVSFVKALFPESYYPYSAKTLMHVRALARETVGYNQLDPDTMTAQLLRSRQYQIEGPYTEITYTNVYGETATITPDENGVFTISSYNATATVTGGVAGETCIHLVWTGSRSGYEPYVKRSYPLDSSLTLRGLWALDADGKPCCDGDTYEADGTVTRKYGVRPYEAGDSSLPNAITDGTNTVYLLDAPETESAAPFTTPQVGDDWGTERFTVTPQDGVSVPVGGVFTYPANLRDKLQRLPGMPDATGDYIVHYDADTGLCEFIAQTSDLPDAPTTDGTYTLKITVADGEGTLAWVADA